MSVVRMRFPQQALEELRRIDPQTPVSLSFIRRLVKTGAVPSVPVGNGNRRLVNFDALCAYTGPDGLGGAIYHAGLDRTVVPVDDAGILADVQHTPEARRLPGTQELQKLCPEVEITLCR